MKKFRDISSMMFLIAFVILFNFSAFAGTWKQDTVGWWYQSDDGSYPKGNWKQVDNTWYYFDTNGYMKTGWIQSGDKWYYCNLNGSLATNCWVGEYYVGADGEMYVNKTTPDGYEVGGDGKYMGTILSSNETESLYQRKLSGWKQQYSKNGYYSAEYLIQDFNQDGVQELLLLHSMSLPEDDEAFSKAELYTIKNGEVSLCDTISNEGAFLSYFGFGVSSKGRYVLITFSASSYSDYIYSITPSLDFMQEVYYTTHGDAGEYGTIYENANHIYSGYEHAIDIDDNKGTRIETTLLN